ncbi:mitochondrial genome maintenance MGM101 [Gorgonomyces haynaldii]|nr:mitochondrial genome maintenance MGM101 [Gorgonomyces haynaldii]
MFRKRLLGIRFLSDAKPVQRKVFEGETLEDLVSFQGVAAQPFPEDVCKILSEPVNEDDIEVKPDGLLYLPEIKYRRILNKAFGPGGWGLIPRGPHTIIDTTLSREYALFCSGRFVSQARGEQDFFSPSGMATASEGCKSNAMMRCCKDLGIAWELWDPVFIRKFKANHVVMVQGTHMTNGTKKWLWRRKDATLNYPYQEVKNQYKK